MSKKRRNILLAFIIPALLFYVVFWISPVLMSFYYGLTNWRGMGDFDIVGMKNYANLIKQGTLFNSMGPALRQSPVLLFLSLPSLPLSLLFQLLFLLAFPFFLYFSLYFSLQTPQHVLQYLLLLSEEQQTSLPMQQTQK